MVRRRALVTALSILFALSISSVAVSAAPGDPDPSFDGDGRFETDLGTDASGNDGAVQPDGKIIVVGHRTTAPTFVVLRLDLDGSLDPTFGSAGIASADFGVGGEFAEAVALAPDGTITVAGEVAAPGAGSQIALARFTASGVLDLSFDGDGMAIATVPGGSGNAATSLVREWNGRLVVGGNTTIVATQHGVLLGYTDAGEPDTSFGDDGVVISTEAGLLTDVAADGTALAAVGTDAAVTMTLVRMHLDGSSPIVSQLPSSLGSTVAIDGNGNVLVGGTTHTDANTDVAYVARFLKNGKIDATFGSGGITTIDVAPEDPFNSGDETRALALQPDGKIMAAAVSYSAKAPPFSTPEDSTYLVRLDATGAFDGGFGSGGQKRLGAGIASAVALGDDGKVVTAGTDAVYGITNMPPYLTVDSFAFVNRNLAFDVACPPAPLAGCATGATGGSSLGVTQKAGKAPKLGWKWGKGTAMLADFGDPTTQGPFPFCGYDTSNTLVFHAQVEGGGTCRGKPCWKALGTSGWQYKDSTGTQWGIDQIKLKAGANNAQVSLQGKHGNLPHVPLPSSLPLRVQFATPTGACFEAVYSTPSRNDAASFKAKSD